MPRFVVLEHDYPELHWDLMLECAGTLRTWRLSAPPVSGQAVLAEKSFDHRLMYLDYEGPVSANRGTVTRWDAGSYRWEVDDGRADAYGPVLFQGGRLRGRAILEPGEMRRWTLTVGLSSD